LLNNWILEPVNTVVSMFIGFIIPYHVNMECDYLGLIPFHFCVLLIWFDDWNIKYVTSTSLFLILFVTFMLLFIKYF